ncbi:MAG: hypothetical protein NW202_13095 [Nitrospira sp.]|nr:hypothetical protein [Nitrospira sp.]
MTLPIDPHDHAAIKRLAAAGLWQQAGLVETLRLQELLTRLDHVSPEQLKEHPPEASQLEQIESELTQDILALFDDRAISREQTLTLLGQVSILIELVKRGQAQKPTKSIS